MPQYVKLNPMGLAGYTLSSIVPVARTVPPEIGVKVPDVDVNEYWEASWPKPNCPMRINAKKSNNFFIIFVFLVNDKLLLNYYIYLKI